MRRLAEMSPPNLRLAEAVRIASRSKLLNGRSYAVIGAYYLATIAGAAFDGIGIVVLVSLVTGRLGQGDANAVVGWVIDVLRALGVEPGAAVLLLVAAALLGVKTLLNIGIEVGEAMVMAFVRARVQQTAFVGILQAGWSDSRDLRVGKMAAALIEEVQFCTRYLLSTLRFGYFLLGTLVSGLVALMVSPELTVLLALTGLPLVLALRNLFRRQSRLSFEQTQERQGLAADITERLNNLFQVKTERNEAYHIRDGLRRQAEIARLEVRIGWGLAFISNFNSIILLAALTGFYLWSLWRGIPLTEAFALLASVGLVGARAAGQLNNTLASYGNLSRISGSLVPVDELIGLPAESARVPVPGGVSRVELTSAAYRFSDTAGPANVSLTVAIGDPISVRGPSGSGKTTLANLISGLYLPTTGAVVYVTNDGSRYASRTHTARVGYVTQDVYLFHGAVRDNLVRAGEEVSDSELWQILEKVGADGFVTQIGGLDAELKEGGRSLSGGERRRLGIARVLASRPEILILDEIMSGLDAQRKTEIAVLIEQLAKSMVVVAITHDSGEFSEWREWNTCNPKMT